jgi:hypothetical protein
LRVLSSAAGVDVLRGLSLLMIFCDHLPGNLLSKVTLHNFGFADAAEAFVLLAGIFRNGCLWPVRRTRWVGKRIDAHSAALLADISCPNRPHRREHGDRSLLDILLRYLVLSSKRMRLAAGGLGFRAIELCGRHSLQVFATGCIFTLLGRLAFRTVGGGVAMQIFANAMGIAAMVLIAIWLDRRKYAESPQKRSLDPRSSSNQGTAGTTVWSGIQKRDTDLLHTSYPLG